VNQPTTAPLLAHRHAAQQARPTAPTEHAFVFDLKAVRKHLIDVRAAGVKRREEFPDEPSFAPTLKQLEEQDFRALVAGGWILL
jgi:hypothetical protein